jgi:SAM-dependent methyltransferase
MHTAERLARERAFHDQQAQLRRLDLTDPRSLQFSDDSWLDHESWIRPAVDRLGDVTGLPVLDLGCGPGMAAVVLARRGAAVTAVDLSGEYLAEAGRRAEANGVVVRLVQAPGEQLPFADGCFARIWGNAVLHHLDLDWAVPELVRVLRPGGIAVFCEPWGGNPLLSWARRGLPYPGKQRTHDETPLNYRHIRQLRRGFARVEVEGSQVLAVLGRILGRNRLTDRLERFDRWLLRWVPALQHVCRYVVITLR